MPVRGQTDFYNLDHERPLRIEDAYATKRWAFELQASPFSMSEDREGTVRYAPSVELKHGLLPGIELSVAGEIENERRGSESRTRLHEIEVSALMNLWVEGATLPAAGIRLTTIVPTEAGRSAVLEARGALTRGLFGPIRAHLNGALLIGSDRAEDGWAGAAVDYVLPFEHLLLMTEGWASFLRPGETVVHSGIGARFQVTPTLVIDAGVGRDWSGEERRDWTMTLGVTHEFGVRAIIPGGEE